MQKAKKPLSGADSAENQPSLKMIHFASLNSMQRLAVHLKPREGKGRNRQDFAGRGEKKQIFCSVDFGTAEFLRNEFLAG